MITIDIKINNKELERVSKEITKKFSKGNKEKLINNINNRIGPFLKSDAEANFKSRGKLYKEQWEPLSPVTIEKKRRQGLSLQPLVATGKLKNSFEYFIDKKSGSVILYNSSQTRDGYNLASIHDQGATMNRYSAVSGNRKKIGIKILARQYLKNKSIKYPKPFSGTKKSMPAKEVFKEFRFRNPLDGSITTKKINIKDYAKYSAFMIQEDKKTVSELYNLANSGKKTKKIRSKDKRYSNLFKKYAAAKKIATSKYGRFSEKSRKALTSYKLPSRILFKMMDYYDEKIKNIIIEETLKLVKT